MKKDARNPLEVAGLETLSSKEAVKTNGGWGFGNPWSSFQASWAWQDTQGGTHWGQIPLGASGTQYAVATNRFGQSVSYYT